MPDPGTAQIISAGTTTAGGLLSMIGQKKREKRAMKNQEKLMGIQLFNQMKLNEQGAALQQQQWKNTSYPAQMKMLKEAGLNPSLLYGNSSGTSGTTGSQGGGSAQGGSAPAPQPMDISGMVAIAKANAEIALMKAQEKKTEAESNVVQTTGVKEAEARINKLIAESTNEYAKIDLVKAQTGLTKIQEANEQYRIDSEINYRLAETKKSLIEGRIQEEAYQDIVDSYKYTAINQLAEIELKKSQISLNEVEKEKLVQSIYQEWERIYLQDRQISNQEYEADIRAFEARIKSEFPGAWNVAGKVLKEGYTTMENISKFELKKWWKQGARGEDAKANYQPPTRK